MINRRNGPPRVRVPGHPFEDFKPSESSFKFQAGLAKSVKLPDGSLGTKVVIISRSIEGKEEEKGYVQDAEKLSKISKVGEIPWHSSLTVY